MSSSREDSPDWLRSYQAPNQSAVTLSSGSESPLSDDDDNLNLSKLFKREMSPEKVEDDEVEEESRVNKTLKGKTPSKRQKEDQTPGRKRKRELVHETEGKKAGRRRLEKKASEKPMASSDPKQSVWTLSSDSDSCPDSTPVNMDIDRAKKYPSTDKAEYVDSENDDDAILNDGGEPPLEVTPVKTPKKQPKEENKAPTVESVNALENGGNTRDMDVKEDISEKPSGPNISSRLPLVISEKVQRSKALVEYEGDSIDLTGDVGAVGRVRISEGSSGNHEMLLDLKGTVYGTSIVPCRTFCVVSFGQSEAKIEAIMNDFIQLRPQSNVYEAETMVEGTLEGFSFDSDDDVDGLSKSNLPANQNEDAEEQPNGKTNQKTKKASGAAGKKVKTAGGKPAKKAVRKKSQAPKKGKAKK